MRWGKELLLLLMLTGILLSAQKPVNPCQIKVKISGIKDTTVYVANYYGSKILKVDSIRLNHQGAGIFSNSKLQKKGIYLLYLNEKNYFEFLMGENQQFTIDADFKNSNDNKFSGADETKAFHDYQLFLSRQKTKQTNLQKKLTSLPEKSDSVKLVQQQIEVLNKEMESYWKEMSDKFKGSLLADFFQSMNIPQPDEPKLPVNVKNPDSLKWVYRYNFLRDHYWDNFNFAQDGLIRTPLFQERLDTYFKKILLQLPDSMINPMIKVIEKSKKNEEVYHYVLLHLLNESNQSQIMGMDKAFVVLSEKFILNEQKTWLDTTNLARIRERVIALKPNLIGNIAPELKLVDPEGNYYSLRQMNADYTLLYFWEPDCSHCQKTTPVLNKDLYQIFKKKGVEIYAVCTQTDKEKWLKGINLYTIQEWTNVYDPYFASNFRKLYDVTSTPIIYILDKNKKIIAKRLDVESSVKFLTALIDNKQH